MSCRGYLKPEDELYSLFPNGAVPIRSIVPMVPREKGAPQCYLAEGCVFTPEQLEATAKVLFELWKPELESLEETKEYILEGLPLKLSRFSGAGTNDLRLFL